MRKYLSSFSINRKNRGEYESVVSDTGIMATQWIDNKPVLFLSNFYSSNQYSTVYRRNRMGIRKSITCPSLIADYNDNMNAVNKFDHFMSNYSLGRRSEKWWHRILFYFLDACVLNAYILYKQLGKTTTLTRFRRHLP